MWQVGDLGRFPPGGLKEESVYPQHSRTGAPGFDPDLLESQLRGVPPSFSTMGVGMVSFGVQRPFGRQKVHRVEVFALESIPRSLALGLDVVRN